MQSQYQNQIIDPELFMSSIKNDETNQIISQLSGSFLRDSKESTADLFHQDRMGQIEQLLSD